MPNIAAAGLPAVLREAIRHGVTPVAKRVFFSFHYRDVSEFRANVVRTHWSTKPEREEAGYFDASIWESARKKGDDALKRLINDALENTSNTCVLVGSETWARPWVRYEILKSFRRGNHLFGVHINSIKSKFQRVDPLGLNPLEWVGVTYSGDGRTGTLWEKVDGTWNRFEKIDGSANFECQVADRYRGKGFNLSNWYPIYDWTADDGYNNFATWVR